MRSMSVDWMSLACRAQPQYRKHFRLPISVPDGAVSTTLGVFQRQRLRPWSDPLGLMGPETERGRSNYMKSLPSIRILYQSY
jgi:hypothetical protein